MLKKEKLQKKMNKKEKELKSLKKDMHYALINAKRNKVYKNLYDDPSVKMCYNMYDEKRKEIKEILNQIRGE